MCWIGWGLNIFVEVCCCWYVDLKFESRGLYLCNIFDCLLSLWAEIICFFMVQTINLAAICTPADYNTRPLDTIYSNFIDALPVVCSSFFIGCSLLVISYCWSLIMWNMPDVDLFIIFSLRSGINCTFLAFRWNTVQRTISGLFTSPHVKFMEKQLVAIFLKTVPCGRWGLAFDICHHVDYSDFMDFMHSTVLA